MAMTNRTSRVSEEIVLKAYRVLQRDAVGDPPSAKSSVRKALEAVWPEPMLDLDDAELAAVIVALRFTDSGESHEDVMSAITKLEAEDNRRYDERDGHA